MTAFSLNTRQPIKEVNEVLWKNIDIATLESCGQICNISVVKLTPKILQSLIQKAYCLLLRSLCALRRLRNSVTAAKTAIGHCDKAAVERRDRSGALGITFWWAILMGYKPCWPWLFDSRKLHQRGSKMRKGNLNNSGADSTMPAAGRARYNMIYPIHGGPTGFNTGNFSIHMHILKNSKVSIKQHIQYFNLRS